MNLFLQIIADTAFIFSVYALFVLLRHDKS